MIIPKANVTAKPFTGPDPKKKNIIIKDLSYRYGGKSTPFVLKNISCTIPEGKTTAIVGASGSGKTTLVKLLLKFHKQTEGSILIDSDDLNLTLIQI